MFGFRICFENFSAILISDPWFVTYIFFLFGRFWGLFFPFGIFILVSYNFIGHNSLHFFLF